MNEYPAGATAVNTAVSFLSIVVMHDRPQLIPAGADVTTPTPLVYTVSLLVVAGLLVIGLRATGGFMVVKPTCGVAAIAANVGVAELPGTSPPPHPAKIAVKRTPYLSFVISNSVLNSRHLY
jgi:hypothetical protein